MPYFDHPQAFPGFSFPTQPGWNQRFLVAPPLFLVPLPPCFFGALVFAAGFAEAFFAVLVAALGEAFGAAFLAGAGAAFGGAFIVSPGDSEI